MRNTDNIIRIYLVTVSTLTLTDILEKMHLTISRIFISILKQPSYFVNILVGAPSHIATFDINFGHNLFGICSYTCKIIIIIIINIVIIIIIIIIHVPLGSEGWKFTAKATVKCNVFKNDTECAN